MTHTATIGAAELRSPATQHADLAEKALEGLTGSVPAITHALLAVAAAIEASTEFTDDAAAMIADRITNAEESIATAIEVAAGGWQPPRRSRAPWRWRLPRRRAWTHPDVLTTGVSEGWAEPETDPSRIDWPPRQAAAAIPFQVLDGRPVNPCASTGVRHGRNEMGRWGETLMADALVTVTYLGIRYLLMVERGDGYGWAVPGGHVEPGETGVQAATRELAEETGLEVPQDACRPAPPLYVPDPRASDEAWAVTIPVHMDLGPLAGLPSSPAATTRGAPTGSAPAPTATW